MSSIKEIVNGNEEEYDQIIYMLESRESIMFDLYQSERKDSDQDFLEWLKSSNSTSTYEAFRREIIIYYAVFLSRRRNKNVMCILPDSKYNDIYHGLIAKYQREFNNTLFETVSIEGITVIKQVNSSGQITLLNSNELKSYRGSGAEIMIFEHFTSIHPDLVQPFLLMKDTRSFFVPSYESVEVPLKSQQP